MPSSSGEATPSSPVVPANAAPPTVTTMEVKMDAGLLAAACSGSFHELELLLVGRAPSSAAAQPASLPGDVEACLRESLPYMVTVGGDTLLHVVARSSDFHEDFLEKASLIFSKAENLLFVQSNRGDTPLHCAARAGSSPMVALLIDHARGGHGNTNRVKELLGIENKNTWTVLHEAVHIGNNDMVKLLMEEDLQLASFPKDGMSPLYLAILQRNKIIAQTMYELSGGILSYSGPNGQNALHVAVLRCKDLTKMLLEWNNTLTLQQDENGSTPLHFAAVAMPEQGQRQIDIHNICSQVLEANPDALYQPDHNGSFPIHVAAYVGATWAITDFLKKAANCVGLRDFRERTFLHVAVDKMKKRTVDYACRDRSLSWILNMKDNNGNTALHQAIQAGSLTMFCSLYGNKELDLNLTNEMGETPLDIASCNMPTGLYYNQNSEEKIHMALKIAGAKRGICHLDYFEETNIVKARQDTTHKMDQVKEGTQSLCIGSVLIATVTFGASFAIPGGYRADDHSNGGTPTLAGSYSFDAFTFANALAFTSSAMATISLMSSGSPLYNLRSRSVHLRAAYLLMSVSITSLVSAFALGTYMMLAPVAPNTTVAVCVMSSLILLYQNLDVAITNCVLVPPLCRRMGICHGIVLTFPLSAFTLMDGIVFLLWPILVIFCLTVLNHTGRKVDH